MSVPIFSFLRSSVEVIRQTDPAAYQEFQQQISSAISLNRNSLNQGDLASAEETMDSLKAKKAAYVKILEQPAGKGLRFRYECEGRVVIVLSPDFLRSLSDLVTKFGPSV